MAIASCHAARRQAEAGKAASSTQPSTPPQCLRGHGRRGREVTARRGMQRRHRRWPRGSCRCEAATRRAAARCLLALLGAALSKRRSLPLTARMEASLLAAASLLVRNELGALGRDQRRTRIASRAEQSRVGDERPARDRRTTARAGRAGGVRATDGRRKLTRDPVAAHRAPVPHRRNARSLARPRRLAELAPDHNRRPVHAPATDGRFPMEACARRRETGRLVSPTSARRDGCPSRARVAAHTGIGPAPTTPTNARGVFGARSQQRGPACEITMWPLRRSSSGAGRVTTGSPRGCIHEDSEGLSSLRTGDLTAASRLLPAVSGSRALVA